MIKKDCEKTLRYRRNENDLQIKLKEIVVKLS